ncbi:MAG: hypothetical protein ACYDGO_06275 [Smithellaceae bacterium]
MSSNKLPTSTYPAKQTASNKTNGKDWYRYQMIIPHKYEIRNKIFIEPDMFYSKAFKCLSASAIRTLMRCLQKRKWGKEKVHGKKRIVYYDDPFIFPYGEAAFLEIGNTQHWKNIIKLVEVGFLEIEHQGGWYQKHEHEKDYSRYINSDRWKKYGTSDFKKIDKLKVLPPRFHIRQNMKRQKLKVTSLKRSDLLRKHEDDEGKKDNNRLHNNEVIKIIRRRPKQLDIIK